MSSHHIVRDAQEPALVIASMSVTYDQLGQLLEWSPVVVVLENCLEHLLSLEIKVDKIICQAIHYQSILEKSEHQQPLQIFPLESKEVIDFLHFAIQNLIENGHDAISIIGEDFNPSIFKKYIQKAELIVYQENRKSYFVKKGVFKKWVIASSIFYFPEIDKISNISGLEEITPQQWRAAQTGLISFEAKETVFLSEN